MTQCNNCGENWNFKHVMTQYLAFNPSMDCPSCGERQYLSSKYAKRCVAATLMLPILMLLPAFFDISVVAMAIMFTIALVAIVSVHLFTIELMCEDERWPDRLYDRMADR
ncbi:TIGR04104 family putative zinc finger protein [Salinicoccus siamensis]|uniref:TIGR04104 family putative zinc finger protein n=2 Tax=Salinicoccus siamensis TaxID=381830 RepID=A0ABV5Z1U2_9STAP